jgi:hypothetical protein
MQWESGEAGEGEAMKRVVLGFAIVAGLMSLAASADAVEVSFSGGSTGSDPLGHTYQATNNFKSSWGEPGLGAGTLTFNPSNISNGAGNFATGFSFVFSAGVDGAIDQTPASGPTGFEFTTRFSELTQNILWNATFVGSNEVDFTAPVGTQINFGDQFFVNVAFTGTVNLDTFAFNAAWTDPASAVAVPSPGTLPLFAAGLGVLGLLGLCKKKRLATA